jgi:ribose transport system substrate-binding protein
MAAVAAGDKSAIPADKMKIVPTKEITKANVDEFWTNLKKLRGK